jgi:electron-transferring-flavoprotein dehydrogenase
MSTIERDVMNYDTLIVGAGPAGLACALRLRQLDPGRSVCVIEKAAALGAHSLSGAIINPAPLDELLPGWRKSPPPIFQQVKQDRFQFLTAEKAWQLPTPPQQRNHGNIIVSLGQLVAWLGAQAESAGVDVYTGFAAAEPLFGPDGAITGVQLGDMGRLHDGSAGPNFTPGAELRAPLTVLAEGCRGSLSERLIAHFALDAGCSPPTYGLGLKELWQLPPGRTQPGLVRHTVGWPLDRSTYGGGFIYHLGGDQVYVGFIVGLDYADTFLEPFEVFQRFKHHPSIRTLLEGGEPLVFGARSVSAGGWQALPRTEMPGALLIGDAAGLLNVAKLKGVHQALRSGMLAAEHIVPAGSAAGFDAKLRASGIGRELRKVRNIKPGFKHGLWFGLANGAFETLTGGLSPWTLQHVANDKTLDKIEASLQAPTPVPPHPAHDRVLPPRDRSAAVYLAQTVHEERQPVHLKVPDLSICVGICVQEYGNPCTRFCPAGVYEMVDDESGGKRLQINAANCVHCKACDIKDPYRNIIWTVPEGGSGPIYRDL